MASLLDEPPVATCRHAMRIAGKYCMEDTEKSIVAIISKQLDVCEDEDGQPLQATFELVGMLAEFPSWFKVNQVIKLLDSMRTNCVEASDLVPLQGRLDLMATIIEYSYLRSPSRLGARLEKLGFKPK